MSEFFNRIRLIPRDQSFLDIITGSTGQIYINRDTGSLRIYDGKTSGGAELARNDFENVEKTASLDLQSKKNRIRFHWDTLADLQAEVDPVVYHGMIAHVHSEGRLYFAHAGEWVPVANLSELSEAGTTIPYEVDEDNNLQWVEGEWDFGQNIIKYANVIQTESELDNYSPVTYHGMTMHVHESGALYYAHAGAWRKLITDTSYNDPTNAGYIDPLGATAYSNNYADLDNAPSSILDFGITDGSSGEVLQTDGNGNFSFVAVSSGGSSNSFSTIVTDDGETTALSSNATLELLGGTNISTFLTTGTNTLDINLDPFSINFLSDVDTQSILPETGEVLRWNGVKWAPSIISAESDLVIGSSSSLKFKDNTDNNTITIKAPTNSSNYTLILPTSVGSTGDALIIDSSGNLSFGDISVDITNQTADTNTYYPVITTTTSSGLTSASVSSSKLSFQPSSGTLTVDNLTVSNDFQADSITETSSYVLKTDIEPIQNAVDKIVSLSGINYTRISSGKREAGLIAEEVEKILPELVDSAGEYKSISYSRLTAYLIESVKTLKKEIEILRGK